jgi:methylthioribulose-1-phosphate dehydratase
MTDNPRPELIEAACLFYGNGWMLGTAGNLSARTDLESFWITASGKSKGKLSESDFVRIDLQGRLLESPLADNRPSAEISIHQVIYSLFKDAGACFHVHSIEANLVSRCIGGDRLLLPPIEMLKGLGIWDENPRVYLEIFKNHPQVPRIAGEIANRFRQNPPSVPALLIAGHGITVWAPSIEQAVNYVEIAEYLLRYCLEARRLGLE